MPDWKCLHNSWLTVWPCSESLRCYNAPKYLVGIEGKKRTFFILPYSFSGRDSVNQFSNIHFNFDILNSSLNLHNFCSIVLEHQFVKIFIRFSVIYLINNNYQLENYISALDILAGNSKFNGSAAVQVKNRPRIPTPDVTKEVLDRESRFANSVANIQNHITSGVALMPHQLQSSYPGYPSGEVPVVQVVLSPIQELDGTGSVNNTLHAGQPGTAALAQAVLSPGLGPVLTTTPMTVSQLTSIGLTSVANSPLLTKNIHSQSRSPSFIRAFQTDTSPTVKKNATITEVPASEEDTERHVSSRNSNTSNTSMGSDGSSSSKDTKESLASNHSNTTASVTSKKSLDSFELGDTSIVKMTLSPSTSTPASSELISLTANLSSPASMVSLTSGEVRSRKTSVASQSNGPPSSNVPKRGEVYVWERKWRKTKCS